MLVLFSSLHRTPGTYVMPTLYHAIYSSLHRTPAATSQLSNSQVIEDAGV